MNSLYAFLHPVDVDEEKEVVISNRFKNEDGSIAPFKIRALKQSENDAILAKCRQFKKINGQLQETLDSAKMAREIIVASTVYPDFASKELCDHFGVLDPTMVPGKMLKPGEYAKLLSEIQELSGFDDTSVEEQAKN